MDYMIGGKITQKAEEKHEEKQSEKNIHMHDRHKNSTSD